MGQRFFAAHADAFVPVEHTGNEFLTRLLIQMAKGRVLPRRGAVLAYVTNQLLHSHVVAEKESADEPQ